MQPTLYNIYKDQGQALPSSVDARFNDPKFSAAATQAGITKDQYKINSGNADYNTQIASLYGKTPVTSVPLVTPPVNSNSGTTQGTTPPVTPVREPTNSDMYGNDAINSASNTYSSYLTNPDSYLSGQGISESNFRAKALAEMQGSIDSTNAMYANKLSESKRRGAGVLGSTGAIQARRGLLGSDFGQAQVDNVNTSNQEIYDNIEQERLAKVNDIMTEAKLDSSARYAKAVEAGEKGLKFKLENLRQAQNQLKTGADQAAQVLLASKADFSTMTNDEMTAFAKEYGTNKGAIQAALSLSRYTTEKEREKREEELANDLAKKGIQDIGKGATGYAYNPKTKKYELVARGAQAGGVSSGVTGGAGGEVSGGQSYAGNNQTNIAQGFDVSKMSPQAQSILKTMNIKGGTVDDYVKDTKINAGLRKELQIAVAAQGGFLDKEQVLNKEAKDIVDNLITTNSAKALGGYSTVLGGQLSTSYGDAKAKANQLVSMLSKDNLGLLKGPMSDKDLAFIKSMSSGFDGEGVQSEEYINERLTEIQTKLQNLANASASRVKQPVNTAPGTAENVAQSNTSDYNYDRDIKLAQDAIAQGADEQAVMDRFYTKYAK